MAKVLKALNTAGQDNFIGKTFAAKHKDLYVSFGVFVPTACDAISSNGDTLGAY